MLQRRWTVVGGELIHSRETEGGAWPGLPPIILMHGVGTTTRYFRPLLRTLQGRAQAAALELPGIGPSTSRHLPRDVGEQADVLAGWLRATGWHPATLVGNSMGAQTVVEVALRYPELTQRLVLIGPTMDPHVGGALRQVGRLVVDATVERPSLVWLTLTDSLRTRRRAVYRYFRAALAHPMADRIAQVHVPILLVRGERDPVATRRWVKELFQIAPDAELVEVPGAGHACHHGRPRAVAELLLESGGLGRAAATAGS